MTARAEAPVPRSLIVKVLRGTAIALIVFAFALVGLLGFSIFKSRSVEKLLPVTGQFIEVDGGRIHYVESGTGPRTLVLIHGLAGTGRYMLKLAEDLSKDHRVIVIDRPGAGYSTRASEAQAGLSAQADMVAEFIRKKGLALDRPVIVGHSLGGAVALALAARHAELVGGLALISPLTSTQEVPAVFKTLAMPNAFTRRLVGWTLATPVGVIMAERAKALVFEPEQVPSDFDMAGGGLFTLRPVSFITSSEDFTAAHQEIAALGRSYAGIRVPAAILYGTEDRILDYRLQGEGMPARIDGLKLELIDGAGHMIPFTMPARVAEFVRAVAVRAGATAPLSP